MNNRITGPPCPQRNPSLVLSFVDTVWTPRLLQLPVSLCHLLLLLFTLCSENRSDFEHRWRKKKGQGGEGGGVEVTGSGAEALPLAFSPRTTDGLN